VVVRPASHHDVGHLAAIEVAAGERFREVGMDAIADDEPLADEVLHDAVEQGRLWVAELDGEVVGYALGVVLRAWPSDEPAPGAAAGAGADPMVPAVQHHLEQVSVVPTAGGRGVGAGLVQAVADWAWAEGAASLTLSTFGDLPWNAPWYERLGFEVEPSAALDPVLQRVLDHEAEAGLDVTARVCMRLRR
jgi:GNAT superfamily N-acetyltransferase